MRRIPPAVWAASLAVLAAAALRSQSGTPEGGLCPAAGAVVQLDDLQVAGGHVTARGRWQATGGATGVLLEYRADSDRYRAESRGGDGGAWDAVLEFGICGTHVFRANAIPLVPGDGRQTACLARIASAHRTFFVICGASVAITDCDWRCGEGAETSCAGACTATVIDGGSGLFVPQQRAGSPLFKTVAKPSAGPWRIEVACKRGEEVAFRIHETTGARRYSHPATVVCGG